MHVISYRDAITIPDFFKNIKFLIVDDIVLNLQMLQYFIEDIGGIVTFAENGLEALKLVQENNYDVIIMDIHMPEMNGIEATRQIRKLEKGKNIPIIGLSADVLNNENKVCIEAGMNDFISKPIEFKKTIAILQRVLKPQTIQSQFSEITNNTYSPGTGLQEIEIMPLDFNAYVNRMGGNRDIAFKIVLGFIKQVPFLLSNLEEAIKTGNKEIIHREAHSIKGGASNIFAEKLMLAARDLELNSKNDNSSLIESLLNKIREEFELLNNYFENNII